MWVSMLTIMLVGSTSAATARVAPLSDVILAWLPDDTEALFVSNTAFIIGDKRNTQGVMSAYAKLAASVLPEDVGSHPFLKVLDGTAIQSAVYVARGFAPIKSQTGLGLRGAMDRCTFLRLPPLVWEKLTTTAKSLPTEHVGKSEIPFISTSLTSSGSSRKVVIYISLLKPDVLLVCSDGRLLSEILNRRAQESPRVALPSSLSEWRQIDASAAIWGLRHYSDSVTDPTSPKNRKSEAGYDPAAVGVTFSLNTGSVASVSHLTRNEGAREMYTNLWRLPGARATVKKDGVVSVEYNPEKDTTSDMMFRVITTLFGYVVAI
jgi:hypothetical protein